MRQAVVVMGVLVCSGCVSALQPRPLVTQSTTARPEVAVVPGPTNGAIYQAGASRPLFEDRRARFVGDTLIIEIEEKIQGSKNASSSVKRDQDLSASVPLISGVPAKTVQGLGVAANTKNEFSGQGASAAANDLTGTISCTVTEVLANGNLLIAGEKQIGINQAQDFIRFSGVVNPLHITISNAVKSTQVADARIEYRGSGYIDEAQVMGWLSRFFMTFLPF